MAVMNGKWKFARPAGGLVAGIGAILIALGSLAVPVAAGGNPDFGGILAASPPTGFLVSPNAYDVSHGAVFVDFDVVAKNLTTQSQTVALNFSLYHILTYNGVNVADGQPGQAGITFSGPAGTTQALMPGTQAFTVTWSAKQSQTLMHEYSVDSCGYFQIDIWAPVAHPATGQRHREYLASGFIRVLGCTSVVSPSPSPTGSSPTTTPSPTGSVLPTSTSSPTSGGGGLGAATSSASPTPAGAVLAASTPGTGAGDPAGGIGIGILLLAIGGLLLIVSGGLNMSRSGRPPVDI